MSISTAHSTNIVVTHHNENYESCIACSSCQNVSSNIFVKNRSFESCGEQCCCVNIYLKLFCNKYWIIYIWIFSAINSNVSASHLRQICVVNYLMLSIIRTRSVSLSLPRPITRDFSWACSPMSSSSLRCRIITARFVLSPTTYMERQNITESQ